MIQLIFDESCAGWVPNSDYNASFLTTQRIFLVEKYLTRGYIYLNEIYEAIGFKWDPTNDNFCWYRGKLLTIEFEQFGMRDHVYLVTIY